MCYIQETIIYETIASVKELEQYTYLARWLVLRNAYVKRDAEVYNYLKRDHFWRNDDLVKRFFKALFWFVAQTLVETHCYTIL